MRAIAAGIALSSVVVAVVATPSVGHAAERVAMPVKVKACTIDDAETARNPGWLTVNAAGRVEDGFSTAKDGVRVPPLWTSNEPPITFARLAERAAPVLWFSPLEFLRLRGMQVPIPAALPGSIPAPDRASPVVYYRIREVRLRRNGTLTDADQERIRKINTPWSCDQDDASLRIDNLTYVLIRYFFYYPRDEGVGGHEHDLESVELQIRSQPFCIDGKDCFYALTLVSAAGSAHGAGWYTNVLQVEDTQDTVLPLTVLVERDKHASSPDRDGNGKYMPHYDTNKYSNDAWGIRDVVATGRLGGASFRAESQDDRRPEDRVFPRAMPLNFIKLYEARGRWKWTGEEEGQGSETEERQERQERQERKEQSYVLEHSEKQSLCQAPPTDRPLFELMNGKNFCGGDKAQTRITRPHSLTTSLMQITDRVSPGPSGRYGFMSYAQRLSVSARLDSGVGISTILPLGGELPLFGGWLVPKATLVWNNPKFEQTQSYAADLLYAPSGSRVYDWHLAGGLERWRESENGGLHWGPAGEAGVKFRYNAEKLRKRIGFQFVGARIAVRTSSFKRPADAAGLVSTARRTRLVFEVGAGAW